MKWGLLTGGLCLAFHLSFAQMGQQFGSYHRLSVTIPESLSYSADSIARYLREHYKTPKLRLQALYSWITTHIRYNNDSSYYYNRSLDYEEKIAATLRRKKGVCENYADLLADLASRIGLRSHV
ncbi:MAG: transglutaminase domain-containing protein, partial [Chitinophagaceae bacterium]|nr:transglutaminase domain-containing protein [Chitinophagaceae bacterium]